MSGVNLAKWRKAVLAGGLDSTAKLVALAIGAYMNRDGYAYPSKQTIADGCGFKDVTTVDRAVNRIETAGLLDVQRSMGRSTNGYQATIPTPAAEPGSNALSEIPTPAGEQFQPPLGRPSKRKSKREVKTQEPVDAEARARATSATDVPWLQPDASTYEETHVNDRRNVGSEAFVTTNGNPPSALTLPPKNARAREESPS